MNDAEYAAGLYRGRSGQTLAAVPEETRGIVEPIIQYARASDSVNIAYYSIGDGPPLVYLTPVSHLEREWQYPEQRAWLERLAHHHRLIRLDFRGTGLSDRDRRFELDLLSLDIEAVVRKEGLERFALAGGLSASALAVLYASRFPEKVHHLVLWCPYGQESVESSTPLQAVRAAGTKDWRIFVQVLAELLTGWVDMNQARRYATYIYECVDADQYHCFSERFRDLGVTQKLGELTMPVLVLQRKETVFPTVEAARRIATNASRARLVLLEGSTALPFLGDTDAVLAPILQFLSEPNEPRPDGLTERELEILTLLAGGSSNEAIARALSISTRTVERHIGNIYVKIDAHNRVEATAYAFRHRIAPAS